MTAIIKSVSLKAKSIIGKLYARYLQLPPKSKVKWISVITAFFWLWGIFVQFLRCASDINGISDFTFNPFVCFISIFLCGFDNASFGLFLVGLVIMIIYAAYYRNTKNIPKTKTIYRDGKPLKMVINSAVASGREMNIEELEEKFVLTYEPEKAEDSNIIFGRNIEDNRVVLRPRTAEGDQRNVALFGTAGCGKTTNFILPLIAQLSKAEENMVINDPSGEIFANSYHLLKRRGYQIKVINTEEPLYSDGWNFIGDVGTDFSLAQICAKTILDNTLNDKGEPFWEAGMNNLLAALILYVNYMGEGNNNIKTIISMLKKNLRELTALFNTLDHDSPAYTCFEVFIRKAEIAENVLQNLGYRLNIFIEPERAAMVSKDDIHISDFGDPSKKSAYFLITDDQDTKYSLIACLFVDMTFKVNTKIAKYGLNYKYDEIPHFDESGDYIEQEDEDDSLDNTYLPRALNFIIDEFCNTGKYNEISTKLSTVRKYNIVLYLVIQSMPQLLRKDRYSPEEAGEILENCRYKLCLSGEGQTAEYFSKASGEMGILTTQKNTSSPIFNFTDSLRYTEQKRPVFSIDDIQFMENMGRYFIMFIQKAHPVQLKKFYYKELEDYKTLPSKQQFYHIRKYNNTMRKEIIAIRKKWSGKTRSTVAKPEDIAIPSHVEEKKKKQQEDSLYYPDGTPKFQAPDVSSLTHELNIQNRQLSIMETSLDSLKDMNTVPDDMLKIKWNVYLRHYENLIYRDENKIIRFKKNKKRAFLLMFRSTASFVELPLDEFRVSGEDINLQAITDKIKLSSDLYEIVEWTAVVHKNPKERQTWAINMIRPMPNKNLTLCPVFAEKKAKKTGFNL